MGENHNDKYKVAKDLAGEPIKLTLLLEKEFKNYNLYGIYKVKENNKLQKLYSETFTKAQYEKFFDNPTYYIAVDPVIFKLEGGNG